MSPTDIVPFVVLSAPTVETPEAVARVAASDQERFSLAQVPELTAALRAGNEGAYRWLHEQWNSRLSRYCFALAGGDSALAQEVAQATYLRIVRHMRVLPDETALWNWIARAARSSMLDHRRTRGRYRRALDRFTEWLARRNGADAPENELRLVNALESALEHLSKEDQSLIGARYFERQGLDKIAVMHRISTRAVEGRLARLRRRLHDLVRDELRRQENER
jgi:RNA polymerase sigma factor (sigma-70 family)